MNDTQIDLIQESFAKVVPIKDAAAGIFYDRLFEIAPEVKPLFKGDMTTQGGKLMAMLGGVVNGLRDLDRIVPVAEKLAVDHVPYGVTAAHYDPVGAALIYTLETGLGDAFTLEVREAWVDAYEILSGVMIDAAYGEGASA
ncbi:globin family protein [Tropicimonas marinistellae]|uniref:globin family protein n=1 Tax=Tropicimonas marinistellae TaxID=1739787 RepID=UPI00082F1A18|nr:globin family protein [Tropicimonas marinistellae]